MASSKLISSSSNSRNSDLSRRPSSNSTKPKPPSSSSSAAAAANQTLNTTTAGGGYIHPTPVQLGSMTVDGLFYNNSLTTSELEAQINLIDTAGLEINSAASVSSPPPRPRTVDEVWQEIVSGVSRKECKEEVPDELMTLEDFLARAGAVEDNDIKDLHLVPPPETERLSGGLSGGMFGFDQIALSPFQSIEKIEKVEGSIVGFGNGAEVAASGGGRGRGKRARAVLEPMDKAAQQRQRRMIKNRESAARSRERKQAYQIELESMAVRLEEENERLLQEKGIFVYSAGALCG
ncbi:G-box-binding factor 4 isoform X2 [Rosa chinensis]|uniref:G-box-binding factor 4 isoform X2 n=1 Tax=Rosa chinensis TaxID=74649 RepID=UPI001AD8BD19|nr:G-box-binding factor 4 isoform X2 [Rosa chinensis]